VPQKYSKLAKSQIFGNDYFEMKFTEYDQEGPKELYLSKKLVKSLYWHIFYYISEYK